MAGELKAESNSKTSPSTAKIKSKSLLKNLFKFDLEYLILIILVLVLIFGARGYALQISAPESVFIEEDGQEAQFVVDIINDSDQVLELNLGVYSPAKSEVKAPKLIQPNSNSKALVLLKNNGEYGEYVGTIEAKANGEIVKKEFFLSIGEKKPAAGENFFSGLFSLSAFIGETTPFSIAEWGVFWFLVIVAAILLVAFVARVRRRF